jgi:hypothetical protein
MSKESKPRDRWSQVFSAAAADRPAQWCKSCGYWPVVNGGAHRGDCCLSESDRAVRLATDLLGARLIDDRITPGRREK